MARRILLNSWQRRGALAWLLWPLSVLYGLVARSHRWLYRCGIRRVEHVAVPVVVVGNVVAGGAGKTPVVMALVAHLHAQGCTVGVLSRGYGRASRGCREVHHNSLARDAGDEPLLIKQTTGAPVFVAASRIEAARALLAAYPDVDLLVCDDGLQHHRLHRDIELCVFDECGLGNGFLLPAGPLREPWPRPLSLVLSATRQTGLDAFLAPRTLAGYARRSDGSRLPLDDLRAATGRPGAQLWAVAGIARPEAFFRMLRAAGLPLAHTLALADHTAFDAPVWIQSRQHTLLCTEKDATKLWLHRPDALAVPLVVTIEPAFWHAFDRLLQALAPKLSSRHGHTPS